MVLQITDSPSPNHASREGTGIDLLVLHYTGMQTGAEALARMRDPAAEVSAHYMVEEDGHVFALVDEERTAWHAGRSYWDGVANVNANSIGIEIVNPGHYFGYRPFPLAQMEAVVDLVKQICVRHLIPSTRVVAHSDIAPSRKEDPGELFPWNMLAKENLAIGLWPEDQAIKDVPDYYAALKMIEQIGYQLDPVAPVATVLAFQRRFCPAEMGRGLNPATRKAIAWAHERFCA